MKKNEKKSVVREVNQDKLGHVIGSVLLDSVAPVKVAFAPTASTRAL